MYKRVKKCCGKPKRSENTKLIKEKIIEVNRIEDEGDIVYRNAIKKLFSENRDKPIEVIIWKEIFGFLEDTLDACEDVANVIEGVVTKMHSIPLNLLLIIILALTFDFINGFHDTANAIATSVSTRVLTPRAAIFMSAVFNFFGAMINTEVAKL